MTSAPAFPLAGVVAVVGSRHGSPYRPASFAAAVVAAGGQVVTGCARGVDSAVARATAAAMQLYHAHPGSLRVFRAASSQPRDLAARTRQVMQAATAAAIFPPVGGQLGPGSRLALRVAQSRRLPVFVAGPVPPAHGFQPAAVASVPGWLWLPLPTMPLLF